LKGALHPSMVKRLFYKTFSFKLFSIPLFLIVSLLLVSNVSAANSYYISMIKDIIPGSFGSDPQQLTNVNGTLYFAFPNQDGDRELWKSDGTTGGTQKVYNFFENTYMNFIPWGLYNSNGTLFFPGLGHKPEFYIVDKRWHPGRNPSGSFF
jgi:ELWxxDGT repeat protein